MKAFFKTIATAKPWILTALCMCVGTLHAQKVSVSLDHGWEFREVPANSTPAHTESTGAWHPATVPGVVQTDLLQNGMIPDPFVGDNEPKLQWIGQTNWEYRTNVSVSAEQIAHSHADLVFDGLDTFATVYVNGKKVLDADNMFRTWRVPVKEILKPGANTLRIVFTSPFLKMQAAVDALPYHLPDSGSGRPIFPEVKPTPVQSYIRKAPYNWGWDWGPRFITAGIWRPARLEFWSHARVEDVFVEQKDITAAAASLLLRVTVEADHEGLSSVRVTEKTLGGAAGASLVQTVPLHAGSNEIVFPLVLQHPHLWWPSGYGKQDRYEFTAQVGAKGVAEDSRTVRTGLRSVVLRRDDDQWGRTFEFVVNGVPVFVKGSNLVPFDSFPTRVTEDFYRKMLQACKDANMNMLRDWGGGYYETDQFYDIADEMGLLIWQEFMYGGGLYPGTREFTDNVRVEAEQQVTRLRNHPSIALFCGNNEVEMKWYGHKDWANWRKTLTKDQEDTVWGDYIRLFSGILPEVVARYDPEAAYWPSSPSNNFEAPEGNNQFGDTHFWSVWHGGAPFSLYEKQYPRLMSEYGFQGFPEMRTLRTFAAPEDMKLDSTVMLAHQKNVAGNEIIHLALIKYYGEPKDFASLLYASQVLQAEGMQIAAEHLRRNRPHTMGTIYWQLNDCWPVISGSSLDYYGRWKALQYYARRFYAPVLVSPHEEDGALGVYVVSDHTRPEPAKLTLTLVDFNGKKIWHKEQAATLKPLASQVVFRIPLAELLAGVDKDGVVLHAELTDAEGKVLSSNDHFFDEFPKNLKLPQARVTATVTGTGTQKIVHLASAKFARAVCIDFTDTDAHAEDNYFDLLPGESRDVVVTSSASAEELQRSMKVLSQTDAF